MKKKKNQTGPFPLKNTRSVSLDKSIRHQLKSLLKCPHSHVNRKNKTAKQSPYHYPVKSTTLTSLNSGQNNELLSKKIKNHKHPSNKKSKP